MNMRFFLSAAFALGCGQGSDSGHVHGHDGAVDLGPPMADRAAGPDTPARIASDLAPEPDLAVAGDAPLASDTGTGAPQDTSLAPADGGCTLVENIPVDKLPPITFAAYHTQQQIGDYLRSVAAAVPEIAQYKLLGQSTQGRDVAYLIINATCQKNPPAILANGTHHGDELSSTEAALALPSCLLRDSVTNTSVRNLLNTFAFYVLPLVNPDGHATSSRSNANGVDINRDYSYPGRSDADSFKTVEAQLIKSLQESVGFRAAIAYHSGTQEVLWPWCYTGDATADDALFVVAGQKAAAAMNFAIYQQSYDDYPTTGEYIDYAYGKSRTLAATFEVSTARAPAATELNAVVERACKGTVAWAQAANDGLGRSLHALPAAERKRFPLAAPFNGIDRLE
jgi:predicted deacylase